MLTTQAKLRRLFRLRPFGGRIVGSCLLIGRLLMDGRNAQLFKTNRDQHPKRLPRRAAVGRLRGLGLASLHMTLRYIEIKTGAE